MNLTGCRWPPPLTQLEETRLLRVGQSGQWTDGPWTRAVEMQMTAVTGARHAIAFNSCTSAIHAALITMGVTPGTRVSAPALTFTGTVTGALHLGANLTFRDITPGTLTATDPPFEPGVIINVDLHGVPHGGSRSQNNGQPVLTDSCQALGSTAGGQHLGLGGTHAWSFSSAKLIAAPDGGAVTTNDPDQAAALRELRNYGIPAGQDRGDGLTTRVGGHNWRPSEFSMAIAASRLEHLPALSSAARNAAARLHEALDTAGIQHQVTPPGTSPAWHKIRIWPPGHTGPAAVTALSTALTTAGIPAHRWCSTPLHQQSASRTGQHLPVTEAIAAGSFCLGTEACPPHTWTPAELDQACNIISKLGGQL